MGIKRNVTMIGDFTDRGPKLFTEKAVGNVCDCIGFVRDRNTRLNVPNTLLKKDIRDVIASPVQKALESQRPTKDSLILYSDQGSQYTSKAFTEFCESAHVSQSMSKAGYPYDNAPMERYFNTLKNECTNLYEFRTEEELYQTMEEFAYVIDNHVRPYSYNGYHTPYQARTAA